ncbi:MAG: pseudouridine synthase, partial [Lachnospiraceae bacterium]|nr:pseudouridine synthase [Lachnospiraceae bacterium]
MFKAPADQANGVRINKYLADAGICSRREADSAVEARLVTIDGETALMGSRVQPGQHVTFKGKPVSKFEDLILIAFNKPQGIVCTTDRRDPDNIIDFISFEKRIFPIGRLDKDSEGLILLTNDGNIVNKILRAGNYHEKEYIVRVNKEITPEFLEKMGSGVAILDTVTRPCRIEQIDKFTFRIILTQGLNRQIRRMCEVLDYRVHALTRVRIMNVTLGRLKTGTYRNLTEVELNGLKELISGSSNTPMQYEGDSDENRSSHRHEERPAGKAASSSSLSGRSGRPDEKTSR